MLNSVQVIHFWNRCVHASVQLKLSHSQTLLLHYMAIGMAYSKDITSISDLTEFNVDLSNYKWDGIGVDDAHSIMSGLVAKKVFIRDNDDPRKYSFTHDFIKILRRSLEFRFEEHKENLLFLDDKRRKKTWK